MKDEKAKVRSKPDVGMSDESLVASARAGDRSAFAQLWQRHARSGFRVARQFTSSIDADDLVSEAYVRIYQRVLAGGGPDGAFRPYPYTTIRNLASRWGGDRYDVNVDDMGDFEDPRAAGDPAAVALDRTLTVRAFRALPERWQSVLWYTEVEGMDPHEVAPILGLTANGVAALSYRAREGLRKAWLQAHVSAASTSGECQWAIKRLGDFARNGLTARERTRVSDQLATCARCSIISEEVDEVGSRLALVMLPLLLGGIAGGGLLASLSAPTSAATATLAPVLPPAFVVTAVAAPMVAVGLTVSSMAAPLIGALAVAIAIYGGLAMRNTAPVRPVAVSTSTAQSHGSGTTSAPTLSTSADAGGPRPASATGGLVPAPGTIGSPSLGAIGSLSLGGLASPVESTVVGVSVGVDVGAVVDCVVTDLTKPVNSLIPGVPIGTSSGAGNITLPLAVEVVTSLDLAGTGSPGATVSLQAAGALYATTTVTPQGAWTIIHVTGLSTSVVGLQLKQTAANLLGIRLDAPVSVLINSLGVPLELVNS